MVYILGYIRFNEIKLQFQETGYNYIYFDELPWATIRNILEMFTACWRASKLQMRELVWDMSTIIGY